jgi:hypothetical protein
MTHSMRREPGRGTAGRVIFMGYPAADLRVIRSGQRDMGADSAAGTETREPIPRRRMRN